MTQAQIVKNEIVMSFLINEALEKTASDIRNQEGSGTTAKAVKRLMRTDKSIEKRVLTYVAIGIDAVSQMEVA